ATATPNVSICTQTGNSVMKSVNQIPQSDEASTSAIAKEDRLRALFRELGSVIVAYSGGVDSSYVAYVANSELGVKALCLTGESASLPAYQRAEIDRVVKEFGF